MSRENALALYSQLQFTKDEELERVLLAVERLFEEGQGKPEGTLSGQGRHLINEAQVREFLLDPILEVLGWKLGAIEQVIVEAPAEPDLKGQNRRFLDYYGREISHCGSTKPLITIEAKRSSVALPAGRRRSRGRIDPLERAVDIAEAIQLLRLDPNAETGFTQKWNEILVTQIDYIERLGSVGPGIPRCAVITNGEWFLVFRKPRETFYDGLPVGADILVFADLDDAMTRADSLASAISFDDLITVVPPQNCANLHKYVDGPHAVVDVCIAAKLSKGKYSDVQPTIAVDMVALVQISPGDWIQFERPTPAQRLIPLRNEAEKVTENMVELSGRASRLLEQLGTQAVVNLMPASEFSSRERANARIPKFPSTVLFRRVSNDGYLLVLGEKSKMFVDDKSYDGCAFHSHGKCAEDGMAAGDVPIVSPSVNPPAYFPSGSPMHCAHGLVHSLRAKKCEISLIETHLCCRKCAMQESCWPEGMTALPCRHD